MSAHGCSASGLEIPHGADATSGRFGRMFPTLPARKPTGLPLAEEFGLPGGKLDGGQTTEEDENPRLPSGFTYLAQFIDHNITFDPTSALGQANEPTRLSDFHAPALNLGSLYGGGPVVHNYLYDPTSHGTKLAISEDGCDLARTTTGIALIGDPRNDENMLLAQFHRAMIQFHNALVDGLRAGTVTDVFGQRLPAQPADQDTTEQPGATLDQLLDGENYYNNVFASAQQLVRWHYQWIIVNEFLPLVVDRKILGRILHEGPRFYQPGDKPFMPVEFAAAAFRGLGHPTVRSSYQVNAEFAAKLFPDDPTAPTSPRTDLRGGPVSVDHKLDFSFFFPTDPNRRPQHAKRFEAKLNSQLLDLPVSAVPGAKEGALARPLASLAVRNLLRSEALGLPSGQDVARKIGEVPLSDELLESTGPIYLWYYVLKESEVYGNSEHLGPVGSTVVAETLIGLLDADPTSYRSAYPQWSPTLAQRPGRFGIVDLLRIAGA